MNDHNKRSYPIQAYFISLKSALDSSLELKKKR